MNTNQNHTSYQLRRINRLIEQEWRKTCTSASDAHFRAEKIAKLEKQKEELLKDSNHGLNNSTS